MKTRNDICLSLVPEITKLNNIIKVGLYKDYIMTPQTGIIYKQLTYLR